jgi:hypothetical protein
MGLAGHKQMGSGSWLSREGWMERVTFPKAALRAAKEWF